MATDGNDFQRAHPAAAAYIANPSLPADGEQDVLHTDGARRLLTRDEEVKSVGALLQEIRDVLGDILERLNEMR